MMNNIFYPLLGDRKSPGRTFRLPYFIAVAWLLIALAYQPVHAQSYLQKQYTISYSYESLASCIKKLQTRSNVTISYNESELKKQSVNTLSFENKTITQILDKLLENTGFHYRTQNNGIVIFKTNATEPVEQTFNTIKGRVIEGPDMPLSSVSVKIKNSTAKGTATDANGNFTIQVPKNNTTLIFSFIGFQTKEVLITGPELHVQLDEDMNSIDNVVVVGYGSVNKKDVTGSVSSISAEEINKSNPATFDVGLVGRAAGVHVVKSSGAPGAAASIRIRGGTSVIGNNEPLYIIDGVPIELGGGQGNDAYRSSFSTTISPLASINPADIESINILKDASSAAIYGSRAANGVVIITTKSGRGISGQPNISFNSNFSVSEFTNRYNMLNTDQYHEVVRQAYTNAGTALPKDDLLYPYGKDVYTDWQKETVKGNFSQNYHIGINGSSNDGNTQYSFSGGATDENGVIEKTNFKRYNLRTKLETKLFDKLRLGTNLNYVKSDNNGAGTTFYNQISTYRPDIPIRDIKGNYAASPDSVQANPHAKLRHPSFQNNENIVASFFGEIEVLRGLTLKSNISYTLNSGKHLRYTPSTDPFEIRNGRHGSLKDNESQNTSRIFENTLTYLKTFGSHSLNLMGGASYSQDKSDFTDLDAVNFPNDDVLNNIGSAGAIQSYKSGGTISGLESYFLRTNYNYLGKYYATFTGRADKSTKFGPKHRWGLFPSAALAWRVSEESFLKEADYIDDLKIRVSAGKTGSANFSDFQYATFFATGSFYNNHNGLIVNNIPNPDIRWESTNQLDIAVDYALLNNKIRGSIGYFNKKTVDQILYRDIIFETGARNQYYNIGDFLNRGVEFQIGGDVIHNDKFSWITDFNITSMRGKVLRLNGGNYPNLREGEPLSYFLGYQVAGIFQTQAEIDALNAASPTGLYQTAKTAPGDFKYVDVNGDGFIGGDDNTIIGKADPNFFGGWNNILRYKNLELTAFFNFSVGQKLNNQNKKNLMIFSGYNKNYSTDILNAWSENNPSATDPRVVFGDPNNNARNSDYYIEDASFLRLKNLEVSYTWENQLTKRFRINNIRTFISGTNLLTFTKYKGLDPEVNTSAASNFSQGYDGGSYPQTRTFTLGLNINF